MFARDLVDPAGIGPEGEIAGVTPGVEAHTQHLLEGEDVVVEPIHGSVDIAAAQISRVVVLPGSYGHGERRHSRMPPGQNG